MDMGDRMAEVKRFSRPITTEFSAVSTTATALDIPSLIAQGTEFNQRIGRQIRARGLYLDFTIQGGQSNVVADDKINTMRLLVCQGAPTTTGASIVSMLTVSVGPVNGENFNGMKRVFLDQTLDLASPGRDSTGYMPALRHFKRYIPLNLIIPYTSGGASGDTLWLAMVSDSGVVPNPGCTSGRVELVYTDN